MASPAEHYSGTHFGDGNVPAGCTRDWTLSNQNDFCYRIKTNSTSLDSPHVDVLLLVPVSPTAERDMRVARQAIDMWEGGIGYLAGEMGLGWLAEGMHFHVTVDYVDPEGEGAEFTTYPIVDPEIVVVLANPSVTSGFGISVDPFRDLSGEIGSIFVPSLTDDAPCHGLANPFDIEQWESLPGFDSHHEGRSGTYSEDCAGEGGNVCVSVTMGGEPVPADWEMGDLIPLFDVVAHEFGHCLTLGHVGNGDDGPWFPVPFNDIMAYAQMPVGRNRCVSSLDVEALAVRMSRYLDTDGDGAVNADDLLFSNDQRRFTTRDTPMQVQHEHDHIFASSTGSPIDCPQPDLGLTPGPRTDWTPEPMDTSQADLTITSPPDGAVSADGAFEVTGTLERHSLYDAPTTSVGSDDDADDDGGHPSVEIQALDVAVTETDLHATMRLADLAVPYPTAARVVYQVFVNGMKFSTQVSSSYTVQGVGEAYSMEPGGTVAWDRAGKTVSMTIPRDFLGGKYKIAAPYEVKAAAWFFVAHESPFRDFAPDAAEWAVGVNAPGASTAVDEHVRVSVDGGPPVSADVDTSDGSDTFAIPVQVPAGAHQIDVAWERDGVVMATRRLTVSRT